MEKLVCLGGSGLPETVEFPQSLAILPVGTDLSIGFLEDFETRFSSEDLAIKVFDNSKKLPDFSEEAIQESGMQLMLVSQNAGNSDFWNQSKFETFSNFLGFSTIRMEKEILKFLQNLHSTREKILIKEQIENSKFERELKRLHFAVNYKRGSSSNGKSNSARGENWFTYELKDFKLEYSRERMIALRGRWLRRS